MVTTLENKSAFTLLEESYKYSETSGSNRNWRKQLASGWTRYGLQVGGM